MDVDFLLGRGVSDILPGRNELKKLLEERKITVYQGFDPTAQSLHIGNFIGVRKLAQFQQMGHKVIFLIGDFTALIGDPTDKASARGRLTREQIRRNFENYQSQISNVLRFDGENRALVKYNSEWLSGLSFEKVMDIASHFSVQQMIERDMFQERIKQERPVFLHEFFYPLMQGYDSVNMKVDLEIGGTDQLFNMMAGRTLMKQLSGKDKFVMTIKLLADAKGVKFGKTEGNAINLDNKPEEMYGQMMSMPDEALDIAIELLTDLPLDYRHGKKEIDVKKRIAHDVIKQIRGERQAQLAQEHFEKSFQDNDPQHESVEGMHGEELVKLISEIGEMSMSDAKRMIMQGGVDINNERVESVKYKLKSQDLIKIGKRKFVKII